MKTSIAGGGAVMPLATGQDKPRCVTVDETHLYFARQGTGEIARMGLDGTGLTTLATGQSSPRAVVVDATSVYWTNEGGTVMKLTPK